MNKHQLLTTIVGSQAHGLATAKSDYDYRGVFVVPTKNLLLEAFYPSNERLKHTSWIEGREDDTSWEVGKFLQMAVHCNPTVLETFLAPVAPSGLDQLLYGEWGARLRALFPYVWNATEVKDAFIGYGINQRKKFFDNKDHRAPKYATAYLRVLYNAYELLTMGTFSVNLVQSPIFKTLQAFKAGDYKPGDVINECFKWETLVLKAHKQNPDKQTNKPGTGQRILA